MQFAGPGDIRSWHSQHREKVPMQFLAVLAMARNDPKAVCWDADVHTAAMALTGDCLHSLD